MKKKNISNNTLCNAKTEKEKQIKNDPKRTSKQPSLNQRPGLVKTIY